MNLGDNVYPKDPFTLSNLQSLLVIEISQLKKFKIKKKKKKKKKPSELYSFCSFTNGSFCNMIGICVKKKPLKFHG